MEELSTAVLQAFVFSCGKSIDFDVGAHACADVGLQSSPWWWNCFEAASLQSFFQSFQNDWKMVSMRSNGFCSQISVQIASD